VEWGATERNHGMNVKLMEVMLDAVAAKRGWLALNVAKAVPKEVNPACAAPRAVGGTAKRRLGL